MAKYKLKRGVIYRGTMYKAGEQIEIADTDNYSFSWLKQGGYISERPAGNATKDEADDLIATEGLPPLDEEPKPKHGKKNV